MLKSYEINNFKSFKNTTIVDFKKTNYHILSDTNTCNDILKGMMFVGANASGKSNSIIAVKFLLDCLLGKNDVAMDNYICLFSKDPTMALKYTFVIDNCNIEYRLSYQRIDKFIKEELLLNGMSVFKRDGSVATVEITEKTTHTDVPKNTLFLRDIYFNTKFRGNSTLQKWFEFLSNSVYLDLYEQRAIQYRDIDLSLKSYIEERGAEQINSFFDEYNFEQHIEYDKTAKGNLISVEAPEKMIYFKRKGIEEPIPYMLESLGNRTLLRLLPFFFHCIENSGMLLLDEFSSGFHNELEELLIRYFMRKSNGAQLIFVSHSTNLISNSLLRPDQIYSVDFGKNGSCIKKFSSEKPREAQNLEKMYLGGVFNGVPKYEYKIK
ncbi:MAG: AAA family ATPase [Oscillospiraceae bacterium]|nr:AAA family ATPase [Oscillospiraceae bacterium]